MGRSDRAACAKVLRWQHVCYNQTQPRNHCGWRENEEVDRGDSKGHILQGPCGRCKLHRHEKGYLHSLAGRRFHGAEAKAAEMPVKMAMLMSMAVTTATCHAAAARRPAIASSLSHTHTHTHTHTHAPTSRSPSEAFRIDTSALHFEPTPRKSLCEHGGFPAVASYHVPDSITTRRSTGGPH